MGSWYLYALKSELPVAVAGFLLLFFPTLLFNSVSQRLSLWNFYSLAVAAFYSIAVHPRYIGLHNTVLFLVFGAVSTGTAALIAARRVDFIMSIIVSAAIQELYWRGFFMDYLQRHGNRTAAAILISALLSTLSLMIQLDFRGIGVRDWRLGLFLLAWALMSGMLRYSFGSVYASVLFFLGLSVLMVAYLFLHP